MNCCETKERPVEVEKTKVHIHLHVADLEASTEFYRTFFGEEPVKNFPEYRKFLPSWAPVNLALSKSGDESRGGAVSHFGIQLPDLEQVSAVLKRIKASGLYVREEIGVNCCHANQDKFWVKDPMGTEWEVYHLNFDLSEKDEPATKTPCCVGTK